MRRFVQAFTGAPLELSKWSPSIGEAFNEESDHYNLGKGDDAWVLLHDGTQSSAARFRWGLVPSWSKTPDTRYTTVTARLDRAARSRIFGKPWKSQHCIIPMNGYYKWDRTSKPAIPYFIQSADGHLLFAAGLWELWERGDPLLHSFAILTHPNEAIPAPLTPDGPIFLDNARAATWLEGPKLFPAAFLRLSKQPLLTAYAVTSAHRDRARDDYTLLEPRSVSDYHDGPADKSNEDYDDEDDQD